MTRSALFVFFVMIVFASSSCRRKPLAEVLPPIDTVLPAPPDSTLKDFIFIPAANARWVVKMRGISYYDTLGWYIYDSAYYKTTTIVSTGESTQHYSRNYRVYKFSTVYFGKWWPHTDTGFIYLREDLTARRVYAWTQTMNVTYPNETLLVDYSLKPGDTTGYNGGSPITIAAIDSFPLAGQYCKRWLESKSGGKSYFKQSYGIGNRTGILPWVLSAPSGERLLSTDFYYKNDSVHID
jgi:hypothetical protein